MLICVPGWLISMNLAHAAAVLNDKDHLRVLLTLYQITLWFTFPEEFRIVISSHQNHLRSVEVMLQDIFYRNSQLLSPFEGLCQLFYKCNS